jgi:hypothetical protein
MHGAAVLKPAMRRRDGAGGRAVLDGVIYAPG